MLKNSGHSLRKLFCRELSFRLKHLSYGMNPAWFDEQPCLLASAVIVTKRSLTITPTTTTAPPEKTSIAGMAVGTIFLALLLGGLITYLAAQRGA